MKTFNDLVAENEDIKTNNMMGTSGLSGSFGTSGLRENLSIYYINGEAMSNGVSLRSMNNILTDGDIKYTAVQYGAKLSSDVPEENLLKRPITTKKLKAYAAYLINLIIQNNLSYSHSILYWRLISFRETGTIKGLFYENTPRYIKGNILEDISKKMNNIIANHNGLYPENSYKESLEINKIINKL